MWVPSPLKQRHRVLFKRIYFQVFRIIIRVIKDRRKQHFYDLVFFLVLYNYKLVCLASRSTERILLTAREWEHVSAGLVVI